MSLSIRYIAPPRGGWAHPAGSFARGTRDYCRALAVAGYLVWIDSECPQDSELYRASQNQSDEVRAAEKFAVPITDPEILIISAFMIDTKQYDHARLATLGADRCRARILQTTFETTRPSDLVLSTMRLWDAVFVPSEWNASCLRAAGIEHVYAVPHAITDHYLPLLDLQPPQSPARTFGWVGAWEPRKAGQVAVRAFVKAFEPGEARLILKTNTLSQDWRPYPPPFEAVNTITAQDRRWRDVDWRKHIDIRATILSRAELFKLYEEIDVFVSTSHGEGFCLPGLEAKLAGRRVVATDSGGVREFIGIGDLLVPGKLGACPWARMYGWPEESLWYHHDEDEIAAALRASTMMQTRREFDWTNLDTRHVGARMDAMIRSTVERCER